MRFVNVSVSALAATAWFMLVNLNALNLKDTKMRKWLMNNWESMNGYCAEIAALVWLSAAWGCGGATKLAAPKVTGVSVLTSVLVWEAGIAVGGFGLCAALAIFCLFYMPTFVKWAVCGAAGCVGVLALATAGIVALPYVPYAIAAIVVVIGVWAYFHWGWIKGKLEEEFDPPKPPVIEIDKN